MRRRPNIHQRPEPKHPGLRVKTQVLCGKRIIGKNTVHSPRGVRCQACADAREHFMVGELI